MNALQLCLDSFHTAFMRYINPRLSLTQRNFVADFLFKEKWDLRKKVAVLHFWAALWGT